MAFLDGVDTPFKSAGCGSPLAREHPTDRCLRVTPTEPTIRQRATRREAVENRERLLVAARQVFALKGPDAPVEEIARFAGVGMGTFYRHFETKQALVDELVGDLRRRLLQLAKRAQRGQEGQGLERLLVSAGRSQARDPGYVQFLWSRSTREQEAVDEFLSILSELVQAGQQAGRIRPDVVVTDVWMTLWSMRGIIEMTRTAAPHAWKRYVDILVAALRVPAAGDAALGSRPLSLAEARQCISAASR